jgi:molecular chaperone GrpE
MSKRKKHKHPEDELRNEVEESALDETEVEEAGAAEAETESAEEWRDKYFRTLAELDNYRKRMERERRHERRFAQDGLMRSLLPVLDSLEIACNAEGDLASIRQGIELALQDALRVLGEHGLQPIEALGKPFDPMVHEAMRMIPADAAPGTVVEELSRGYLLHDRVLRASKVCVAMQKPEEDDVDDDDGND